MPTKITLTPKQKAALESVKDGRPLYDSIKPATAWKTAHPQIVSMLRHYGFVKGNGTGRGCSITPLGLQWLADDAQPVPVKEEAQVLPDYIASRLPEGYMT